MTVSTIGCLLDSLNALEKRQEVLAQHIAGAAGLPARPGRSEFLQALNAAAPTERVDLDLAQAARNSARFSAVSQTLRQDLSLLEIATRGTF